MYKQVLIPDKNTHTIEMPEQFFGKKVEVIVVELVDTGFSISSVPPAGKKVPRNDLFEYFGAPPDFPSADEIRAKAWPAKW